MAEYIEREALIERLKFKRDTDTDVYKNKYRGLESAIAQVKKAPAADVVEVKHGRWNIKYPLRECGCCGEIYTELGGNGGKAWNYCPNCGARMDGE